MTRMSETTIEIIDTAVWNEFRSASSKFKRFNSGHEGFAVLKEEVDELWEVVKLNKAKHPERSDLMRKEATQVAAMALRFLHDVCFVEDDEE